jgi:transaldolase
MFIEEAKFSLWCDFVERDFLEKELPRMVEKKIVNGATSNPAIFKNAFLNSPAYKTDIETLKGENPKAIYEALAIKDIKISADILKELYEKGDDGFISIEVDPLLCDDAEATIAEAKRLHAAIDAPNIMIKVPATKAGFIAMQALFTEGINVNATLIFSPKDAKGCLDAFENGLKAFKAKNLNIKAPKAVISIFVSRFDRKMNSQLSEKSLPLNRVGILNATQIYHDINERNIEGVRTLFASTGVKGKDLEADHYITELLFANCVNTAPLETIEAFLENKTVAVKEPTSKEEITSFFQMLSEAGIDMNQIYEALMDEGLEAFKEAFKEILKELEKG